MQDYLSKSEIAQALADEGLGGKVQISRILDGLANLAAEELQLGNDFQVPGIVKLGYAYRAPQAKGARWKKGDEVVGFGGVSTVKDADSPPVKASIKLRPSLRGVVGKCRISTNEMPNFLKSKTGKAVIARLAK